MNSDIILVNYNSGQYLKKCLDSIHPELNGRRCSILIIDNSSKDHSVEYASRSYPRVRTIINKQNLGFARAVNIGIRMTSSDYILLLNPDAELLPNSFGRMIRFMEEHPDCGVLGGLVLYPDGRKQESCRRFPTPWTIVLGRRTSFLHRLFPNNPFSREYLLKEADLSKTLEVDFVAGTFMMLRRKALETTGLFDEDFFLYVEDVDLCMRMRNHGWKVCFYPETICRHHYGETIRKDNIHPEIYHARSMLKFFKKHYHLSWFERLLLQIGLHFKTMQIISWSFFRMAIAR